MNFGTFKTRLALNVGNMKTDDPFYAYLGDYVNDAVRLFIMRASEKYPNFQLFPEHKDIEWTDITVADNYYLALPSDQWAVQRVFSADSATAPTLSNTSWRLVTWIDPKGFDQLTKPTSQNQYPSNYTLREGRLYLYPTPRAGKTTYIKVDGIQDEPTMTSSTDTPRTSSRWHPAILDYAGFMLCTDMGYTEDAARFLTACDKKIESIGANFVGLRKANVRKAVRMYGLPRLT